MNALPRWTREPAAGVGEHETMIPGELVAALRRRADELAVSFGSVLLAAHARVLAALSGESEVAAGHVAGAGRLPLLCRMTTERRTWRALLVEAHQAESELPIEELRRELGFPQPSFETVFDPAAQGVGDL